MPLISQGIETLRSPPFHFRREKTYRRNQSGAKCDNNLHRGFGFMQREKREGSMGFSEWRVGAVVLGLVVASGCGVDGATVDEATRSSAGSLTSCEWDPRFGLEGCQQGEWWVEFSVRDRTTASMVVEVQNSTRIIKLTGRVNLGGGATKFTGSPGSRLPTGTMVRVKATQATASGGRVAYSNWFPYLQATPAVECTPAPPPPPACTPSCAPGACGVSDGCGGTCGPCAAGQSCVNNACVCVPSCGNNVCGSDGCGGTCGTCSAATSCQGGQCVCTPSCAPGACGGSDGCGGTCGCATGSVCTAAGSCCQPNTNSCGPDGCGNDRGPCTCGWDPQLGSQDCSAGEWWVEFAVSDTSGSMQVEVVTATGTRTISLGSRVALGGGRVKFTGSPGGPIATGSMVRVKVTQLAAAGGQQATSTWFPYLQGMGQLDCPGAACTPSCAPGACGGADGCGGTCGCGPGLSCVNNTCACVPSCGANECGSDGCGGTCGTCGTNETCSAGQCACTPTCAPGACGVPDGCGGTCGPCGAGLTCVNQQCACVPSCGANTCGSDGCGGTCGSCARDQVCNAGQCVAGCVAPWDPAWAQGTGAGDWWTEWQVSGGGALTTAVWVERVDNGRTWPISYGWGRWAGDVEALSRGTLVRLHARNALGATARTVAFRYQIDLAPVTDACAGTAAANTTCQPLSRGMVSFTFDDSGSSQPAIAIPLLQQRGMKGTFYVVPQWHSWTPLARTLAAEGHEFAAHGMTHNTLTGLSAQQLDDELRLSKQWIETNIGVPVSSFATPSAAYNDTVVAASKQYYGSHRTGNTDLNFVGSDLHRLNSDFMYNTTTVAAACARLKQAADQKGWLVLTFHDFTTSATASQGFTMPQAAFEGILACAATTPGLDVVTVRDGAAKLRCGSPP
jgi:peptidoglycan/xylan/chitin deacetylase (PgdA/CDA1 family)